MGFYSLRTLKRDHGAIYTFLEEAENERMHLLVCLKMFEASPTLERSAWPPNLYDAVPRAHLRASSGFDAPLRRLPRRDGGRDLHELGEQNHHSGHEAPRRVARTSSAGHRQSLLETRS